MRFSWLVCVLGALAACAPSESELPATAAPTPASAITLLRGNGPEPDSLDPQRARSFEAQTVLRDLYECLTAIGKDGSTVPGLAREWSVTGDGLLYTFTLRPEARWSNGDPVVAQDVVFALRRLVDRKTASQYAQVIDVLLNAKEIVRGKKATTSLGAFASAEGHVVIRLAAPAPYLPALLAHPSTCPVHRPTIEREGARFARPGIMVSNGAFTLAEWTRGTEVVLKRNPHYWNDAATQIDVVRYLQIPDENAEFTRYRAGQLHITAVVPRGQFDLVRERYSKELHIAPQLSTNYYGFNLDREPFKSQRGLRRALSMVIDRERLASSVLRVGELPAYGWIPPGVHDYRSQTFDYAGQPMDARIEEARQLYAAAGYSQKNPLRFELRYNTGEIHSRLALAIASMWKQALGVQVTLVGVEFKSLLADVDRRDVDLFRASWSGDYNDAYTFAQYLTSDFGINLPRYRNAAYDALLASAAVASDMSTRRALLEEAERTMLVDTPLIPLYFYVNKHLVSPRVQGWYDNVMNVVYTKDLSLLP